jgi:hypothetical protein
MDRMAGNHLVHRIASVDAYRDKRDQGRAGKTRARVYSDLRQRNERVAWIRRMLEAQRKRLMQEPGARSLRHWH